MNKLVALVCVVSWTGFWAFGYLALTSDDHDGGQMTAAILLAAAGLLSGVFAYMRLCSDRPMNYRRVEQA